jgi:plasmid maintenance system antidote protein VapI
MKIKNLSFLGFPKYEIHLLEDGTPKIYSLFKNKYRKVTKNNDGYTVVNLSEKGIQKIISIHRIVALSFIENDNQEEKKEVNHIDGDKNNNNVENLEWVTHSRNNKHAFEIGLKEKPTGEKHGGAKLKETDIFLIKELVESGNYTAPQIAHKFGIATTTVRDIVSGKSWTYLNLKIENNLKSQKLKSDQKEEICKLINEGKLSSTKIAEKIGCTRQTINQIKREML